MALRRARRKKSEDRIVALYADTHGGHKLGLMNPDVLLYEDDEHGQPQPYSPQPIGTQHYMWRSFQEDVDGVFALSSSSDIVILHDGDLTHGHTYAEQLVRTDMASQILIAVSNFAPWFWTRKGKKRGRVKKMRLAVGTGAHNFREASTEVLVCEQMRALHPELSVKVIWHGLATVGGVTIDYAHHGPHPGIRIWTSGNQLRYYLKDQMLAAIVRGEVPPKVFVRAHYHELMIERVEVGDHESWIVVLPSYCGLSGHGHQATRSKPIIHNGMVALVIRDNKLADLAKFARTVDLRTKETL